MNSYKGSEDDKLWSENESPNNQPMPKGQISDHLQGPGKGVCPLCNVAEEVCK